MDKKALHTLEFPPVVVMTTVASREEADLLARTLVEERLSACTTMLPSARSVYRWEGEIHEDEEYLLFIKSRADLFPALDQRIREMHSYQIPEVLQIEVTGISDSYLSWMIENLRADEAENLPSHENDTAPLAG